GPDVLIQDQLAAAASRRVERSSSRLRSRSATRRRVNSSTSSVSFQSNVGIDGLSLARLFVSFRCSRAMWASTGSVWLG
ncbi:hypothetical protein LSAT2_022990, partial [Lamellibrachia satsuma]